MKAKRKRDGRIVEVEKHGDALIGDDGKVMYYDEIEEITEPDYNQVRIQAAIAAMQGQLSNDKTIQIINDLSQVVEDHDAYMRIIVASSVRLADALVEELKKGD